MVLARAILHVIAVAQPKDVDRLRLVVHAESDSQGGEVRLDGPRTDSEMPCCGRVTPSTDIGAQSLHLSRSRPKPSTTRPISHLGRILLFRAVSY